MKTAANPASRRQFLQSVSLLAAASAVPLSAFSFPKNAKLKVALIGTGIRGITFWGRRLQEQYSEILEFVGLSDINKGGWPMPKSILAPNVPLLLILRLW